MIYICMMEKSNVSLEELSQYRINMVFANPESRSSPEHHNKCNIENGITISNTR